MYIRYVKYIVSYIYIFIINVSYTYTCLSIIQYIINLVNIHHFPSTNEFIDAIRYINNVHIILIDN